MDAVPIDSSDYRAMNGPTDTLLEGLESLRLEDFKLPEETTPKTPNPFFSLPPPPIPLDLNIFSKTVSYKKDPSFKCDTQM